MGKKIDTGIMVGNIDTESSTEAVALGLVDIISACKAANVDQGVYQTAIIEFCKRAGVHNTTIRDCIVGG